MKKLYSQKDNIWIKIPKPAYKVLIEKLAKDQIAEFYLSFDRYMQDSDKTVKEIILVVACFEDLINSDSFLKDLNDHSDKSGNIDWKKLLAKYKSDEFENDLKIVF